MKFIHYVILAVIAGILTYWGRILFLHRTEYYRMRPLVKKALENTISKVGQHNYPWVLVRDDVTDDLIRDILRVMPLIKRIQFKPKWEEYRYDKKIHNTVPSEYEKSTDIGRRLITERLHNLIQKI